jgi:hypothetical protein
MLMFSFSQSFRQLFSLTFFSITIVTLHDEYESITDFFFDADRRSVVLRNMMEEINTVDAVGKAT